MKTALPSCLCLCIMSLMMSASALNLNTFPEKFLAGPKYMNLTLTCNTNSEEPVTWNLDNEDSEIHEGKNLIIHNLQEDLTGNYTCLVNGEVVDYTYVLLDISQQVTDYFISCIAETFNCTSSMSCSWKAAGFDYFRLRNNRENSNWVWPSAENQFQLTHSTNPFAEETEPLEVVGEAVSSFNLYFKTRKSFYLRDVIKPGRPKLSLKNRTVFVDPPETWAMPLSYYPLEHEIEIHFINKMLNAFFPLLLERNMTLPNDSQKVRVRCRDSVLLSQWSKWTEWRNVCKRRSKKNKDGKKKKRLRCAK